MAVCYAQKLYENLDREFPGIFRVMQKVGVSQTTDLHRFLSAYHSKGAPVQELTDTRTWATAFYIYRWSAMRMTYDFARPLADLLVERMLSFDEDSLLPAQVLEQLPYKCFAIHTKPLEVESKNHNPTFTTTGDAIIALNEPAGVFKHRTLFALWYAPDGFATYANISLIPGATIAECLESDLSAMMRAMFSEDQIMVLKGILGVDRFIDVKSEIKAHEKLVAAQPQHRFLTDKAIGRFLNTVKVAAISKFLINLTIQHILYLVADNADIEDVIEKLREGKDTSVAEGKERKTVRRTLEKTGEKIKDVGFHIGATITRGQSKPGTEEAPSGTGRTVRSHPVRGHNQPIWHGPRNGPIAEDFSNPKPGERYIVMHWVDEYITKPGQSDDLPTIRNVR